MKKLMMIGVALCLTFVLATPLMAVDIETEGSFRVRGRYRDSYRLDPDRQAVRTRWDTRLRLGVDFIVSDNLKIVTQTDIRDNYEMGTGGPPDSAQYAIGCSDGDACDNDDSTFDMDYLYGQINVPFGSFRFGRMLGGAWGTKIGDSGDEFDRVRFDTKFGDFMTGVIVQKNVEQDYGDSRQSDADSDTYYWYGVYKSDMITGGLLAAYANVKTRDTVDIDKTALLPYFEVKFGNLGVQGELIWETGTIDYDHPDWIDNDLSGLTWGLMADYKFGAFKVLAGYAQCSGQDNDRMDETGSSFIGDITMGNAFYGGIGDDLNQHMFVLTDMEDYINGQKYESLSDNLTSPQTLSGVRFYWLALQYRAAKNLRFEVNVAKADALETWTDSGNVPSGYTPSDFGNAFGVEKDVPGQDDDYGIEYGFKGRWDIMKNLRWTIDFGYLNAGDFWKGWTSSGKVDDTYAIEHELRISF